MPKISKRKRLSQKKEPKKKKLSSTINKDILNLPNMLTMMRVILIPVVIVLLSIGSPSACFWSAVFFGVAAGTDFFDGYLARKMNLVSVTGKFLDPLADKIMVMAVTVQLTSMGWLESWIPIVLLLRELAIQGLRQIASADGMVIAAGTGGKLKTACQLVGLVGLLLHYTYTIDFGFASMELHYHRVGWWLLVLSIFFSLISAVQYFAGFYRAIEDGNSDKSDK